MYSVETQSSKLELDNIKCYEEDYKRGNNPYNSTLSMNVQVDGFCGQSEWTIDFDDLKEFAYKLKKLYDDLKGELQLADREYGSILKIKCENSGHICFSGKLIGSTFQKLEFQFVIDQTYLKTFAEKLYNDFGMDFQELRTKKKK